MMQKALIAILLLVVATPLQAQSELAASGSAASPVAIAPLLELKSPRATLRTFLRAMRDRETDLATSCLDLGQLTKTAAETSGPRVAYQLHGLIKHLTDLSLNNEQIWEEVPDENDLADPYPLSLVTGANRLADELVLRRSSEDGNWRFSSETCERVEFLYNSLEQVPKRSKLGTSAAEDEDIVQPLSIRIRELFPAPLRQATFILPAYQWICLFVLIFVGLAADVATRRFLAFVSVRWVKKFIEEEEVQEDEGGEEAARHVDIWRPIGRLVNAAMWYGGTKVIGLPPATLNVLLVVLKIFTIFAAAWTAFAIIDLSVQYLTRKAARTKTKFDDLIVPLLSRSLKMLTVCIALLTAAQAFDVPVLGLMGGLGLGGAALALASKDAVANFFGSVTVLFDRPFEVGDWIITEGAEGTVEKVGFRSTRIRTFYNSLITLPNSQLTTATVDNMGRRRYRRIKTTLGVQYDTTPAQMEAFCEGVRELIRRHPDTRKDYFHVYFNDFGPNALDIMLYCFVQSPDWGSELESRHRLLSDIVRLADKLDVKFAFPTRTVHMYQAGEEDQPPEIASPKDVGRMFAEEIDSQASE